MNLLQYQRDAMRTRKKSQFNNDQLHEAAHGLAGEAAEVAVEINGLRHYEEEGSLFENGKDKLRAELGDVAWYLAELADFFGFQLQHISDASPLTNYDELMSHDVDELVMYNLLRGVGNVNEYVKKTVHHGKEIDPETLKESILALLRVVEVSARYYAQSTLDAVLDANIAKLKLRWPEGFKTLPKICTEPMPEANLNCIGCGAEIYGETGYQHDMFCKQLDLTRPCLRIKPHRGPCNGQLTESCHE